MWSKIEITGLKHFNDSKAFVEYLNGMEDIYKNIQAHNSNKKSKTLIAFDDMVADLLSTEKINPVAKLFFRGRRPKIYIVLITQSHFAAPKNIRLSSAHCLIMRVSNERGH